MPNKQRWLSLIFVGAAAVAVSAASAAGFTSGSSGAVLGQPLDFAVQVLLEAGETLAPECVNAEVTFGERRLGSGSVHTRLKMNRAGSADIHVLTTVAVDEPVVAVLLSAGCSARVSRRFVVLADPPSTATAVAVAAPSYAAAPADVALVLAAADTGASPPPAGPAAPVPPQATAGDGAAVSEAVLSPVALREAAKPRPAVPRRAERRTPQRRVAAAAPRAELRARSSGVGVAASRLKLDLAEPAVAALAAVTAVTAEAAAVDQALRAVAEAASAARASASAASEAAQRIAALERTVAQLRAEADASRASASQLRERLARGEDSGRWKWLLFASVLLLPAAAAWFAWRLAAARREGQEDWHTAAAASQPLMTPEPTRGKLPTSPIPFVTAEVKLPQASGKRPRMAPAWPPPAPADPWSPPAPLAAPDAEPVLPAPADAEAPGQQTLPMPAPATTESTPRDVSIEELIDLEQQAEFFAVLGQDEAAIELLTEHLRHTGGGSPLPYLKLLEIYRRRGDRSDYERTRTRFNRRFNAYAPDWDADLQSGRSLEDYPGVIPRLQQVWARPLDSMAELEALLFRKSRGDLFELPAYREVLFLYSLARDLLDREAADTGKVDLLLPLADDGEFTSTEPIPFLDLRDETALPGTGSAERPPGSVDLDLSLEQGRPSSIFGQLQDRESGPQRR